MIHNEDSRVKLPGLLHFLRLGYKYQPKRGTSIHGANNIFVDVFKESLAKINRKEISDRRVDSLLKEIDDLTNNTKDKGRSFYKLLTSPTGIKLIDLKNPHNNDFRVVSELSYERDGRNFRPDITILINGIPLGFVEVKKPNNHDGIQAEFKRMKYRAETKEFIPYLNQLQVLGFTNNQSYNDGERPVMSGSFYTTPNGSSLSFNHFREEREIPVNSYLPESLIDSVLLDNQKTSLKGQAEFEDNMRPDTPGNRFITSIYSIERMIWIIRYGVVFVDSIRDGMNKHIIRYPQFFAIQSMVEKIENGMSRGIIWHTQGSGKTGLAYFATNVLRDYYQQKNVVTKFYFVVDRLDLLMQASAEFSSRGMSIAPINNKDDFVKNIKSPVVVENVGGNEYKETMNLVNIQKFSDEATVDASLDHKIQRIYFLDEVHRGYKPKGTFLSNLLGVDSNGIFVGLTGTPILKKEYKSTNLFSGYIHKYYYNKSIADGYTLKIKKENISTKLKTEVREMFDLGEEQKIPMKLWEVVGKEDKFVERMCEYISEDFRVFTDEIHQDRSLGYMIVTSSSEQARKIQSWFKENSELKTALVLYDEEYNKDKQEEFRGKRKDDSPGHIQSHYHGVVVYNMLLTGFDAPRLKRLYLLRRIKEHSLLQTLARVNRPYKRMKYGYIVDFVDITEEYEETNKRYLEELREDIADEEDDGQTPGVEDMFVDVDQVKQQLHSLNRKLFNYMGNIETNIEDFREQIEQMEEEDLIDVRSDLEAYKECYNELRMAKEDVSHMPIEKVKTAQKEVANRIQFKRDEKRLNEEGDTIDDIDLTGLIVEFLKMGEMDLDFTTENDVLDIVYKIKNELQGNLDKQDPVYKSQQEEFKDLMLRLKRDGGTSSKIQDIIRALKNLHDAIKRHNIANKSLLSRYRGDESCMRIHKRVLEAYEDHLDDATVYEIISDIIDSMDDLLGGINPTVEIMTQQLMRPVRNAFNKQDIRLGKSQVVDVIRLITDDR